MGLLDNVTEVFDLAHQDRYGKASVDRISRRLVGAALVHRDLVRIAVTSHCLVEEVLRRSHIGPGREQEIGGFTMPVDSTVQVFPFALDLNVRLVHAPT